jgi:uncharacterized membrane protein
VEGLLNPWFIILGITGVLNAVVGTILLKFPPKKINRIYGYRTARSMKNQQHWDFAQRYAGREMIRQGLVMVLIGTLGFWLPLKPVVSAFLTLPVMLILFGVLIFRTETALKNKF